MSTRVRPPRTKEKEKIRRQLRRERYNKEMSVQEELVKQHVQEIIKRRKINNDLVDNASSEDVTQEQKNVGGASTSFQKKQLEHKRKVGSLSSDSNFCSEILSDTSFKSLTNNVSKKTLKAIEDMGLTTMTHVQAKCIPPLLEGYNLIASAKTGSGKTLAFLIPVVEMVSKLKFERKHGIGCVIISPTKELTVKTFDVLKELMAYHSQSCGIAVGGTNGNEEHKILSTQGMNILVATPDGLCYHLKKSRKFHFKNLKCLVFDEADLLFEMGFESEIMEIIDALPEMRQIVLFTAIIDGKVQEFSNTACNRTPKSIDVDDVKSATIDHVMQGYVVCPSDKRFFFLYTFLKNCQNKKVMVFLNTHMCVQFYCKLLNNLGFPAMCIHACLSLDNRLSVFRIFCNANSGILLCTDVAARGLDFPVVDWIVQFDPPHNYKQYIHRVGRTARGLHGQSHALLILFPEQLNSLSHLKKARITLNKFDYKLKEEDNIQLQVNNLLSESELLVDTAEKAFMSYKLVIETNSSSPFSCIESLDLNEVVKSFGITGLRTIINDVMDTTNNEKDITSSQEEIDPKSGQSIKSQEEIEPKPEQLRESQEEIEPKPGQLRENQEEIEPKPRQLSEGQEEIEPKPGQLRESQEEIEPKPEQSNKSQEEIEPKPRQLKES